MVKEYSRKNKPTRTSSGVFLKNFTLMLLAFIGGYLSASIANFTSIDQWFHQQFAGGHGKTPAPRAPVKQAELPKPKFEFYTLLTKEHPEGMPVVQVIPTSSTTSSSSKTTAALPVVASTAPKTQPLELQLSTAAVTHAKATIHAQNFLLQVGSFRNKQEADRIRASLVMKGFMVSLTPATPANGNWYRVVLGPFPTRNQAEKAQQAIAKSEHVMGMIRKMDA